VAWKIPIPWLYALPLVCALVPAAGAQQQAGKPSTRVTDLPALLEAAEKRDPGLRSAEHAITAARARLGEAWVSPFFAFNATTSFALAPEASGTPVVSPDSEFPVENRWLPVFRAEVKGAVPLWTFGKLGAARDAARAGIQGAELERERTRAKLVLNVRKAYFGLQLALDTQQMISEGKEKLEKAVKRLKERLEEGDTEVNPSDQYRLSSTLAEVEARSSEAASLEAATRAALRILTGIREVRVPDCPLEAVDFEVKEVSAYQIIARQNRPETGILGAAIDASKADVDATRSKYLPDIGLALHAGISHAPGVTDQSNPFVSDPANYHSYGAALVARWSLDIWGNTFRDRRATATLMQARSGLEQALEGIELDVSAAHTELLNAVRRLQAWESGHRDARRWFIAAAQAEQLGVGEAEELVDAVRAYFKSRYEHMQAIHDFDMAVARLEQAVGTRLLDPDAWRQRCDEEPDEDADEEPAKDASDEKGE
jgi:outer membrane protein TolC